MNLAFIATQLAKTLTESNVVYLTDDEQDAERLAAVLRKITRDDAVVHLPSSDALPGDVAPASPANIGRRVAGLRALRGLQSEPVRAHIACILSGEAAARRYPLPEAFNGAPPTLHAGDPIDPEALTAQLEALGYFADDRVDEPGEMAVRAEVIDIFPADAGLPARIEFGDGRITAIRSYDPITQRSRDDRDSLEIGRAAEPPIEEAVSCLSHLTPGVLGMSEKADARRQRFVQLATDAAKGAAPHCDAIDAAEWSRAASAWRGLSFDDDFVSVPRFAETRAPLAALTRFVKPLLAAGHSLVLAGSGRDIRFLRGRLAKRLGVEFSEIADWSELASPKPGTAACVELPVDAGFVTESLVLIAAADLLGSRAVLEDGDAGAGNPWSDRETAIRIGDVVVHEDHGIGRIAGLDPAPSSGDGGSEMIALEYAAGARRLVPVEEADRIWRYGTDAHAVTLDKLDGSSWQKRRGTIDAAIAESAKALTALATARAKLSAPVLAPDSAAYERFVSGFPFNETGDQARAIAAVRDDLASGKPMDRLVVGDVGYGKTEVALRAAALAALSGHQVVVAAPTTVLVRQHHESFRSRFVDTGVTVAALSRLSSAAEKKAVKAGLRDGSIQIVIGTGAVMAKGVTFKNLALVVVDEEQRFGAADKLRLRGKGETHLLTLSATPIPRTLQMALIGLQQISIIATPPARRQPIRTSLDHYDDGRIRTALIREKGRGGQSFVVVPRIEDMAPLAAKLKRLVPDLLLVEAHGKMPASDTDEVMVDFSAGRGDVLLATNIIEAGLDVPRANTMIVWRADRFGLAQLHQLRGRVGRGNRRGQVILLTEADGAIGERTLKRLRTLATFDRLGAGFEISARDLDMRGAGDLLGDTQAGHIKLIGIDLYQHLLGAAVRAARGEAVERWTPELHIGAAGAIPKSWIPEDDVRLSLYVRLSRLVEEPAIDAFEDELLDRFGPLPRETEALMAGARIRLAARIARVARIDAGAAAIALTPRPDFEPHSTGLVEKHGRWLLTERTDDTNRRERVQALLEGLAD
ncbi:helicase-related protein [Sphingomonas immobilis]|uniref:Transcription-repair-coupling factor n=1 Tax=Sphingomonas immobilis TaxID=3063997 RepID=A0ABT8ZWI4_9SPHN|nr:helicase-related protein [Sphingomonas sp. CA1-15]MDO7841947.1 helicase-related protein [Sphingomonas sp. CA1-15]